MQCRATTNKSLIMMQVQAIVLSTVLLLCLPTLSMCEYQVINTGRFGTDRNTIELECRNNGVALQGAVFWLNRVSRENELLALGVDVTVRPDGRIVFQITRELEGTFFCGQNVENFGSVGQQLIAYPDQFLSPNYERTFFAKVGTTARLHCSILPGALRAQYFADWRNATSSIEVARLDGPRASSPLSTTPDPRFMVDETTFALIIESVSLSDAGNYQCVLGVRDPAGLPLIYPQTETLNLTLVVYQAPIITESPKNRIIALDDNRPNQSATFHCQARGQPKPEIKWLHHSPDIEDDLNSDTIGKYLLRTDAVSTPTGDYIVSSWLTVNTVDAFDAGEVVCSVMADDDELPTDLQTVQTMAQLAVIGSFNSLDLLISTNGDIIFKLRLPYPILVPVQLSIIYMDANDNRKIFSKVTENAYIGTDLITHFEPSFQVPTDFNTVRIRIALRYQRLQGPFNESPLTFDIRRPNFFREEETSVKSVTIISIAGSVVAICVVITVLVAVLTCITCRETTKRKLKAAHEDKNCHNLEMEERNPQRTIKRTNSLPHLNIEKCEVYLLPPGTRSKQDFLALFPHIASSLYKEISSP
ncbi:uncharacterized protein LOC135345243 isoform X2 [Halichondria panicea]|uniref:uncharacterized protein LOC135345243 isoform X2 n=1 Tax=Halichondria panicea TaxID=6063 RepID=UPI00312B7F97